VTKELLGFKKRGFKVAIDDFGTGYSSLASLQSLPVDLLKIDRRFVADLEESEKGRQIVATIIGLARALGHEVIAEGIETEAQMRDLRRLRCALGQGFYFSPPLEADAVETDVLARFQPWLQGRTRREAGTARGR
jgi:EAL domain-containing protein (putative c-di-GMP-specific phosphodiesterase class I)